MAAAAAADAFATKFYMDDKWKLSKKEGASKSCRASSTTLSNLLLRNSSSSKSTRSLHRSSSTTSSRVSFTRKCASLVKEQRAKFYIMRRCVTMLVCWRDYSDS